MNVISLCAACLVASVLAVFLKKQNAEYSLIITMFTATVVLLTVLSDILIALSGIEEMMAASKVKSEYVTVLLKCVGISFLTEFTCDCCKDASQNALSTVVLMSGRVCVLLAAFPLFEEFLSLALTLSRGEA